jgi:type IV secretory pathway VirB3-like protein
MELDNFYKNKHSSTTQDPFKTLLSSTSISLLANDTQNDHDNQFNYLNSIHFTFENVLLSIFLLTLTFSTIIGNTIVILAITMDYHLRSPTHFLMGSLALADLLLGITVLPFSSLQLFFDQWFFSETICDIFLAADVLWCTASIYLVLCISIDRYIGVTHPLRYHQIMTRRRVCLIIISVWILSLCISLAPELGLKPTRISGVDIKFCEVNANLVYAIFSVSFSFWIPLIVILIVYYRIFKVANEQMKFLQTGVKTSRIKESDNQNVTLRVHIGPTKSLPNTTTNDPNDNKRLISSTTATVSAHITPACSCTDLVNAENDNKDQCSNNNNNNHNCSKKKHHFLNIKLLSKKKGTKCRKCSGILPQSQNVRLNKFKREKKAAKTLSIVVGCFVLCWAPFFTILPIGINSFFKTFN